MKYSGFEKEEHFDRLSFYNGDCMDLLKQTPDKYYDLALVDPPYGINVNVSMGRRKGDKKSDYHKFSGNDASIPNKEYFTELFRISKNQIIGVSVENSAFFGQAEKSISSLLEINFMIVFRTIRFGFRKKGKLAQKNLLWKMSRKEDR